MQQLNLIVFERGVCAKVVWFTVFRNFGSENKLLFF